jgi:hypothetical protein
VEIGGVFMKQLNIKTPLVFRLGVVLLCAMLITFSMVSGLYARYSSTVTGEASVQIAKFDVQITGDANVSVDVSQATDNVYTITIKNDSDVTVQYGLSVSAIPGVSATFDSVGDTLEFGGSEVSRKLTFAVTDWNLVTASMDGPAKSVEFDFTVTVNIEQVD